MRPRLISRVIGNESGSELCVLMISIVYSIQDDSARPLLRMATPNPSAIPANKRRRNAATLLEVFHFAGMGVRQIKTI